MVDQPWKDRSVFITGVCGTVGCELLRQLVQFGPREVVGIDNNETDLFFLSEQYRDRPNVRLHLGDLRDRDELQRRMRGVDVVLHAAALKHVILCERSPREPVHTNILGTQNVIDAAYACGVQRMLFTSSDKAVNPTNVMGTSKLMGERLVTAANALDRASGPIFASTRFGNVLGSNGSVIPLFKRQIAQGGPVTLTDPAMTRFIMTLEEAVRLVMDSVFMAHGGEVFVTKMPTIRIEDLAQVMVRTLAPQHGHDPQAVEVVTTGTRPGEKLYEELLSDEEIRRARELETYFVVLPAFHYLYDSGGYTYPGQKQQPVARSYNSSVEEPMSQDKLQAYLQSHNLL